MRKATATNPKDRDMIYERVRDSVGFVMTNKIAIGALRTWLAKAGAEALARLPEAERRTSRLLHNYADLLKQQGRLEEAAELHAESLAALRAKHGDTHEETLDAVFANAHVQKVLG